MQLQLQLQLRTHAFRHLPMISHCFSLLGWLVLSGFLGIIGHEAIIIIMVIKFK